MKPIIRVERLSKQYQIGARRPSHPTLRDAISGMVRSPLAHLRKPRGDAIWALKEVSFEVMPGEVLGVIGRNGAGKSTLLKVLSRITEPNTGRVELYGRVGSLLEVGTGFHPELTGRENVYLNGAILGMKRSDIARKFDEIVAFAEIERFLDTPVKHYSSGMYLRLAFAVAAHLEPDILLIDEILAVGDFEFQKKCLGKMDDVAKHGRTVIFVSHHMAAVTQLCTRAISMREGTIAREGETQEVIDSYIGNDLANASFIASASSNKPMAIVKAQTLGVKGDPRNYFNHNESVRIEITCKVNNWEPSSIIGFFVRDHRGRKVFTSNLPREMKLPYGKDEVQLTATIAPNFLVPGKYTFTFAASSPHSGIIDWVEEILPITIRDAGSEFYKYDGGDYGCVFANCEWTIESSESVKGALAEINFSL